MSINFGELKKLKREIQFTVFGFIRETYDLASLKSGHMIPNEIIYIVLYFYNGIILQYKGIFLQENTYNGGNKGMKVLSPSKIQRIANNDAIIPNYRVYDNLYRAKCSAKLNIGIKNGERVQWKLKICSPHNNINGNNWFYFIGIVSHKCTDFNTVSGGLIDSYGISGFDQRVMDGTQEGRSAQYKIDIKYTRSFVNNDVVNVLFDVNKLIFSIKGTKLHYKMDLPNDDSITWYPAVSLRNEDDTCEIII